MDGQVSTKEKILQTALKLFAERGYEGTSLQDIAREIGITKAAFYRHFKNKKAIFDSIMERMSLLEEEWLEANALPAEFPAFDAPNQMNLLNDYILRRFIWWTEEPFPAAFRQLARMEQYHDVSTAELFQNYLISGPQGWLEDVFREMMALDLIRPSDPGQTALSYWALVTYYMTLRDSGLTDCAERLRESLAFFTRNNAL